ncbi:hypothetical protein ACIHAA_27060 [Streptomyces sp. NPDC052040]|uniref:hypothetical protein n=1 Tax=unclassified Streptomyces TaxID=2593676 RepID=UPI0037D09ACB
MKSSLRTRSARALPAGLVAVALLTAGAPGAFAATHTETKSTNVIAASITVKPSKSVLRMGESVSFSGRTQGLRAGQVLNLQRYSGGKWVIVKSVKVAQGDTFAISATKLAAKGTERFRVIHGNTMSPTVILTVR